MSSILKALKKLDEEKASRRDGTTDIASEILQSSAPALARPRWLLPMLAVVVLALLGGVSYPLLRALRSQPNSIRPVAQLPVPATTTAPTRPAQQQTPTQTGSPDIQPVTVLHPSPAATKRPLATLARPTAVPPPRPPQHQPVPAAATAPVSAPPAQPLATIKPPTPAPEKKTSPDHSGPTVSVSGIAWQKDSATRLAIVNGQPLATGATIEGVMIEEIMPDRVKFSHNKSSFEVFLGKTGRPN